MVHLTAPRSEMYCYLGRSGPLAWQPRPGLPTESTAARLPGKCPVVQRPLERWLRLRVIVLHLMLHLPRCNTDQRGHLLEASKSWPELGRCCSGHRIFPFHSFNQLCKTPTCRPQGFSIFTAVHTNPGILVRGDMIIHRMYIFFKGRDGLVVYQSALWTRASLVSQERTTLHVSPWCT